MDESNDFTASLKKNRTIILVILMLPVIGMTISIPLIVWRAPSNMVIVLAVIVVLMVQYILLVRWIAKRMDKLTVK
jgi:membrane glycosyltransferase